MSGSGKRYESRMDTRFMYGPPNEEVNVEHAGLYAAADHIATRCGDETDAFNYCKAKDMNPENCLREGRAVTACTLRAFKEIEANCSDSFQSFWECLDKESVQIESCRKQQAAFNTCMGAVLEAENA